MLATSDLDFIVLQVASIRQHLASIYEKEEDWRNAAQVLVGIPLETGQKYVTPSSEVLSVPALSVLN